MSYAVDALADFVVAAEPGHLPDEALMLLRRNVLDSVGCAIAALDGEVVRPVRDQVESVGGQPRASLIGGGRSSVDQAALFNSVAVRYVALSGGDARSNHHQDAQRPTDISRTGGLRRCT
jgi:2-methylcitrate dehydratase